MPDDDERALRRAEALVELRRWRDAIPLLERVVADEPADAYAWSLLSQSQFEAGFPSAALRSAESGISADPEYEWAHRCRAWALWWLGRLDDAVGACRRAVQLEPDSSLALSELAWIAAHAGCRDEALSAADEAIRLYPDQAEVWCGTGIAAQALGDWRAGEQALRKAVELAPEMAMVHNALGWLLLQRYRFDEAADAFRRALELDPQSKYATGNLATTLRWVGDDERGYRIYRDLWEGELRNAETALQANADDAEALRSRTEALTRLGRVGEARESAQRAVEADPDNAMTWRDYAELAADAGLLEEAREALERAAALEPGATQILSDRAWFAAVTGDAGEIPRALQAAIEAAPEDPRVWQAMGYGAMAEEDWEAAEDWFRRSVERRPMFCDTAVWLGIALTHQGRRDEAESWLDAATKINPGCGEIPRLRAALSDGRHDRGSR